jgi:hypothetical protein
MNIPLIDQRSLTMKHLVIVATLSLASISGAIAGPATDAAQTHFNAIAAGDVSVVMRGYGANPQLNWVGGPLDGTYVGADKIRTTWEKFGKAVGPLKVSVANLEESANPKGTTVSANVQFEGKMPIKVRYVLTYRDGMLVSETWQIDPKLAVAAAY